jgi:hypothetical protein
LIQRLSQQTETAGPPRGGDATAAALAATAYLRARLCLQVDSARGSVAMMRVVLVAALASMAVVAQDPQFEAASIRPAPADARMAASTGELYHRPQIAVDARLAQCYFFSISWREHVHQGDRRRSALLDRSGTDAETGL